VFRTIGNNNPKMAVRAHNESVAELH
jgi:hypothetical protein